MGLHEERILRIGRVFDSEMQRASIQKCNCMVRYSDGPQMPAIKWGQQFMTPEGREITKPTSFEMMPWQRIRGILDARDTQYIGHMFRPSDEAL